jgi:hypothetical protein
MDRRGQPGSGPAMDQRAEPRPAGPRRATVDPPHLVTVVRAGARVENGKRIERPRRPTRPRVRGSRPRRMARRSTVVTIPLPPQPEALILRYELHVAASPLNLLSGRGNRDSGTCGSPAGSVPRHGNRVIPTYEGFLRSSRCSGRNEILRLRAQNDTFIVPMYSE